MPEILTLRLDRLATPVGELVLLADERDRLRAVDWSDHEPRMLRLLARHYGAAGYRLAAARDPGGLTGRLAAYFAGEPAAIDGDLLCRARPAHRAAGGGARGRACQRRQSCRRRRALPPSHRQERLPDRLRRRPRAQALAARSRGLAKRLSLRRSGRPAA
jgi:hypothetical protein